MKYRVPQRLCDELLDAAERYLSKPQGSNRPSGDAHGSDGTVGGVKVGDQFVDSEDGVSHTITKVVGNKCYVDQSTEPWSVSDYVQRKVLEGRKKKGEVDAGAATKGEPAEATKGEPAAATKGANQESKQGSNGSEGSDEEAQDLLFQEAPRSSALGWKGYTSVCRV